MNSVDILFVNPGNASKIYQELAVDYSAIEPPTWALLLAERYYFENGGREFLLDEFGLSKETILQEISHLESAAL